MTMLSCNVSKVRRATLKGRKYLVANVTLIVPGVLNGSKGSLYYPPEEVAHPNNVDAWNGMPLVNGHPALNGVHVSARSPGVMERFGLGHVYNVRVNPKTGSLRGQAWFDVESIQRVEPRVLEALEAGRPVEVSTGLFTQDEPAPAGSVYNGREYQYVARKYRPDHLAILIDQEGACSLRDGCGVMVENAKDAKGHGSEKRGAEGLRESDYPSSSRLTPQKLSQIAHEYTKVAHRENSYEAHDRAAKAHGNLAFVQGLSQMARGRHIALADKHKKLAAYYAKQKPATNADTLNCGGPGSGVPGPCPKPGSDDSGPTFSVGDFVEFHSPEPGENDIPMRVLEDNGDRVKVQHQTPRMTIKPTAIYRKSDLVKRKPTTNYSPQEGRTMAARQKLRLNCGGKGGKPGPCPSQMTKAQWFSEGLEYVSQTADGERVSADPTGAPGEKTRKPRGDSLHKFHIRRAMVQGKKIPKEVLTDYPDISTNSYEGRTMAAKTMTKKDAVQFLTTNCDCWKAKGAKTTLNALPDETLNSLVASEQLATAVRNRLGEKAATLTVNQLAETLADEEIELDADLDEGDADEVTENCGEDMAPPAAAAPVEDEDEEEESAPPAPPFAKKKKKGPPMPPTGNSAPATPQRLTMAEWEAVAPLEVLDRDRRAKQVVNAEREKIISKLVANSAARSKDAKDQLRKALSAKSLDDLNLMSLLSTNRKESTERDSGRRAPDYGGMGHVYEEPTTNHDGINEDGSIADDEDGDPLGFPTLSVNWAQEVELSGGRKIVA